MTRTSYHRAEIVFAWIRRAALPAIIAAFAFMPPTASAENIKIGTIKLAVAGPLFIAQDKGYFAAEGLTAEVGFLDAAEPIAVAVTSGDYDFGATGFTGGLYALAGQGGLRIVAGNTREVPGFKLFAVAESNRAYETGLRSYAGLAGHSVGIAQIGSAPHYILALLADKYHLDMAGIRILALQSIPNMISAVVGGQADAIVVAGLPVSPVIERGDAKLLGWVGDEVSYQVGGVFTSRKTTDDRRGLVERFLRAYRHGARDYHDAFTGPDEKRTDGASAPATLALIAQHLGQTPEQARNGIGFIDGDARLDVKDIARQIEWYKAQGMIKGAVSADEIIDRRYVVALPAR